MGDITFSIILIWLLAGFFAVGAAVNWLAPKSIQQEYARWGYPAWFHYVTAILELAVAILLLVPAARLGAAALGVAVMAAAVGTLVVHREFKHAIAPLVVLLLTAAVGWATL